MAHISVLMNEVLDSLDIQPADVIVDGTINGGGHSFEISKQLSDSGVLVGIDLDTSGLALSEKKLQNAQAQINLVHDNFRNIDSIAADLDLKSVDKILLDLGWSSNQFENPDRGFSFMHDGPLLMTLANESGSTQFTAYDIVNTWSQESLMDILEAYGEEKYAWHIVQAILKQREIEPISSTLALAELIKGAVPGRYRNGPIHPATKTFQALRITVNDEMGALHEVLKKGYELLTPGGRMVII
ncbi:MAG: 16S rRNA (cytosine(1402)-N(4))-methyltransferase RsmH, partial [Minisyncoccia bacterium]